MSSGTSACPFSARSVRELMSRAGALPSFRSPQPKAGGSQGATTAGPGGTVAVCGSPVRVRPWSTRTTLPRARLTSSTGRQSRPPRVVRQRGKRRASSAAQVTSRTGWSSMRSTPGVTEVRRTAWRWRGSASPGVPVRGPFTSSRTSTSPGLRASRRSRQVSGSFHSSRRVAEVAPVGRVHTSPPQVHRRILLCATFSSNGSAATTGSKTSTEPRSSRSPTSLSSITVPGSGRSCGSRVRTSTEAKRKVPGARVVSPAVCTVTYARAVQPSFMA